jgi:hypothetical protein
MRKVRRALVQVPHPQLQVIPRYDQAARAYAAPVDAVRKAGAVLQKTLKLSTDQPW